MSLEQVTEAGRPATDDEAMLVRVQREDFSIDEELRRVRARSKRIGGIAIFLGTARDRSKGKDVDGITFEHYEGMAQKKLREIRERAERLRRDRTADLASLRRDRHRRQHRVDHRRRRTSSGGLSGL